MKKDAYGNMHKKLVLGLKDFMRASGFKKAVLGLSGGVDSAVVAALAARALGAENVLAVALPTVYNSDLSLKSARRLAKNLGVRFKVINIQDIFETCLSAMDKGGYKKRKDLTEQNLQPRIRGMLLMACSAEEGAVVLAGSNRSEALVGYSTLYGDTCGALAPIGGVYKTDVYALARYINKDKEVIPDFIITRPASAELKPGQKDQDDLPGYAILDAFLRLYVDRKLTLKEAARRSGLSPEEAVKITLRIKRNAFKRPQSAPPLVYK